MELDTESHSYFCFILCTPPYQSLHTGSSMLCVLHINLTPFTEFGKNDFGKNNIWISCVQDNNSQSYSEYCMI